MQDCIYPYILQARAGSYMCESSNSVGKGRSKEITLDIKCKLPFSKFSNPHSLPPDVPVCASPEPEIYGVSKSELVDIVCRVKANPSEVRSQRCILLSPPYQKKNCSQTFPSRLKRLPFFGLLLCEVSNKRCEPQVEFRWTFNNSAELIRVPHGRATSEGDRSTLSYTPQTSMDYGTLLCRGNFIPAKLPCSAHFLSYHSGSHYVLPSFKHSG